MEKKKMSLLKKIMIGIAIVLLVIIILTFRKVIILTSIHNKVVEYEQGENIYYKATYPEAEYERFIKGKIDKIVMENRKGAKITQIMDETEERIYTELGEEKTLIISKIDRNVVSKTKIPSIVNIFSTQGEIVFDSIVSRIHTEKIDGEKYYVIEGRYNPDILYEEDTKSIKIYINKETKLLTKKVEIKKDGTEKISTYEYSFGTVTDEKIKDPDRTEYKIVEN